MKRTALLLAVMATVLVVASGAALAATYVGTNKGETIVGTGYADNIDAKDGRDVLLVAHGFFNLMVGRELKKLGWRCVSDGGYRYWRAQRFERPAA